MGLGVWAPDREVGPAGYLASVVPAVGRCNSGQVSWQLLGPHSLQGSQSLAVSRLSLALFILVAVGLIQTEARSVISN